MTVSRICQCEVDLVDLDESAWTAAERMVQRGVSTLIVLNRERRPIGIVTDRDLVVKVIAGERLPRTTRVRDIMTAPVITILNTLSVPRALSLMRSSDVQCLPVVDGGGKLVGIITLADVLSHLLPESDGVGRLSDQQTSRAVVLPPDEL